MIKKRQSEIIFIHCLNYQKITVHDIIALYIIQIFYIKGFLSYE